LLLRTRYPVVCFSVAIIVQAVARFRGAGMDGGIVIVAILVAGVSVVIAVLVKIVPDEAKGFLADFELK
jgi:uncharacterized membrane protein